MSSNESDPITKRSFMPRWAVAGLSAVALMGALSGCGNENSDKTRVIIPFGAQSLGMDFVGTPGLKYVVPADQEDRVDCGYRTYFENVEDRIFGSPKYIQNFKRVVRTNQEYPIVVCEGTSSSFAVVRLAASHNG